jgi:medium-chain acyl-[acyl-carrier-protein] hydrolase
MEVEVCAVRPPGRESRLREPAFTDLVRLAEAVGGAIRPFLDRPFALFGHSLGAWVAFELARWMRGAGFQSPVHLFVSGRRAPRLPSRDTPMHALPDDEFVVQMRQRYGGIPDEVLHDRGLLELVLPGLRGDVTAVETYQYVAGEPLTCPLSAFGGIADARVLPEELGAWCSETSATFRSEMFGGGHFFVESARAQLLRSVSADLTAALSLTGGAA